MWQYYIRVLLQVVVRCSMATRSAKTTSYIPWILLTSAGLTGARSMSTKMSVSFNAKCSLVQILQKKGSFIIQESFKVWRNLPHLTFHYIPVQQLNLRYSLLQCTKWLKATTGALVLAQSVDSVPTQDYRFPLHLGEEQRLTIAVHCLVRNIIFWQKERTGNFVSCSETTIAWCTLSTSGGAIAQPSHRVCTYTHIEC